MSHFLDTEKQRQVRFKQNSSHISSAARHDGLYRGKPRPFCLPSEYAGENLFVGVRPQAVQYFSEHTVQWHQGIGVFPSNHLCSSQVCCVNFLFPFASHPDALTELLRPLYPTLKRVLPIETSGEYVAFEWIGAENYLRERATHGGKRTRGANCTSADAAVYIEHESGLREIVLIEWKYTESYGSNSLVVSVNATGRTAIYQHLFEGDGFVLQKERLPAFETLFFEPFYQFFRQQSLAHKMECAHELGANRVSLLHIAPAHNLDFRRVTSPALRLFAGSAVEVWKGLLARPDRFTSVATETLFRSGLAASFPDLRDWWDYVSERYGWLLEPVPL